MQRISVMIVTALVSASGAFAQEEAVCMPASEMEAALVDWYGETPTGGADTGSEVWTSGVGGTWTVLQYEPDGTSCVLAQGDNWRPSMDADMLLAQMETNNG